MASVLFLGTVTLKKTIGVQGQNDAGGHCILFASLSKPQNGHKTLLEIMWTWTSCSPVVRCFPWYFHHRFSYHGESSNAAEAYVFELLTPVKSHHDSQMRSWCGQRHLTISHVTPHNTQSAHPAWLTTSLHCGTNPPVGFTPNLARYFWRRRVGFPSSATLGTMCLSGIQGANSVMYTTARQCWLLYHGMGLPETVHVSTRTSHISLDPL